MENAERKTRARLHHPNTKEGNRGDRSLRSRLTWRMVLYSPPWEHSESESDIFPAPEFDKRFDSNGLELNGMKFERQLKVAVRL